MNRGGAPGAALDMRLRCTSCGTETRELAFGPCPSCLDGALEPAIDATDRIEAPLILPSRPRSVWDFAPFLPAVPPADRVALGEAGTPLVEAEIGAHRVLVKHEGTNPTLSFKDRFSAVNVSVAKALGYRGLILSSTGNAGLAAATYACHAGLEVRVICPPDTPVVIQRSIRAVGADLQVRPSHEHAALVKEGLAQGRFPGSRGYPFTGASPFGAEGYKTIAYEIVGELGQAPGRVFMPLGGGDGLFGVHKGFRELRDLGVIDQIPRMFGVRTSAPWAISIARDPFGPHGLAAITGSGGAVINVGETELTTAMRELARVGVLAEPSSAASVAGFLADTSDTQPRVGADVCVVTSHLAKWWDHVEQGVL